MSQTSAFYTIYDEYRFRAQVEKALTSVRTVLDNTKQPGFPNEIDHTYDDKYAMVNTITNNMIGATLNCLALLGMTQERLAQMKEFGKRHSVSLRFASRESCWWSRKVKRTVESPKTVTTVKVMGIGGSMTESTTHTVKDYYWFVAMDYQLFAYYRNKPEEKVAICGRHAEAEVLRACKRRHGPPLPNRDAPPQDVNITWLLNQLDEKTLLPNFHIDRAAKSCHTPRRNAEMVHTLDHVIRMHQWLQAVVSYFFEQFRIPRHDYDLTKLYVHADSVLVPSTPVFLEPSLAHVRDGGDLSLTAATLSGLPSQAVPTGPELQAILNEELRSLKAAFAEMDKMFPHDHKLLPVDEKSAKKEKDQPFKDHYICYEDVTMLVILLHLKNLSQCYHDGVEYVEDMLRKQLINAIGKEVGPVDFAQYMEFHNRRLFKLKYQPPAFSHAVRQPDHFPEGEISIQCNMHNGALAQPIRTHCSRSDPTEPMYFNINASTKVGFLGDRYLHGFVAHQFQGSKPFSYTLEARTRQFSSFILLLGSIGGEDIFYPKQAIILQNKDELKIPLDFETIPPPKEFKDKISSISPEQQRFAKAIRNYQLAGSLFGILVIHIKPQLEKLLKVPQDGLIKEIALTQELMELFIKYNIPSDLLGFGGKPFLPSNYKIEEVKRHVEEMNDMVAETKERELKEVQQERIYAAVDHTAHMELTAGKGRSSPFLQLQVDLPEVSLPIEEVNMPVQCSESAPSFAADEIAMDDDCFVSKSDLCMPEMKEKAEEICYSEREMRCEEEARPTSFLIAKQSRNRRSSIDFLASECLPSMSSLAYDMPVPVPVPVLQPVAPKIETPAEKRVKKAAVRDEAQRVQDVEELRLQQLQVAKVVEAVEKPVVAARDYTVVPGQLDEKFEALDDDNALCTTTIKAGLNWTKKYKESLLAAECETTLDTEKQKDEKNKAYDLLDALTKSGTLLIDHSSLHIVCAATHCFGESLMNTVVRDNINPAEKVERSNLIVASVVHGEKAEALVEGGQVDRVKLYSPKLFLEKC